LQNKQRYLEMIVCNDKKDMKMMALLIIICIFASRKKQ